MSNGLIRILVSVAAIPIILAASYIGGYFFLLLILVISLISYYEFSLMIQKKNAASNLSLGLFSVLMLVVNGYFNFFNSYLIVLLIVAGLSIAELFRNKVSPIFNLASTLLGVFYLGLFSSALVSIREFNFSTDEYSKGGLVVISILAGIWICDSAAYYIGTAFGKHKLFPRVSPNKSWEGAAAGFGFALLTLILAKDIFLDFLSWKTVFSIGLVIGTLGQIGDLIESLIKRDAEVKDSSSIIPGHGGVFDRFDSLLFSAPFILLVLNIFERQ